MYVVSESVVLNIFSTNVYIVSNIFRNIISISIFIIKRYSHSQVKNFEKKNDTRFYQSVNIKAELQ